MSDFPDHVIYHPIKMDVIDPIEQLRRLRDDIDRAKTNLARYQRLHKLPLLHPERLMYNGMELYEKIEHWQMTVGNLERCWNGFLDNLKIK